MLHFVKYQALGNNYIVLDDSQFVPYLTPAAIERICDRNFGLGSDGVLVRDASPTEQFAVRVFNPDGSEAEISGNGVRIFARYLWDQRSVGEDPFQVITQAGPVTCCVGKQGREVTVEMGRVSFHSADIPVSGPPREVLNETMNVHGHTLRYSAATVGNPHCVIVQGEVSAAEARALGPLIEHDPRFPNRTNVQFMQVLNRANIKIEIWERGAGYTLASGSSSCAAAAVAHRLGFCDANITAHMPGGALLIEIDSNFSGRQRGPVEKIASGRLSDELLEGIR